MRWDRPWSLAVLVVAWGCQSEKEPAAPMPTGGDGEEASTGADAADDDDGDEGDASEEAGETGVPEVLCPNIIDGEPSRGEPLADVVNLLAPLRGGSSAPTLEVYPRSGMFDPPMIVRLCVEDADGVANLDPDSLSVTLDGREVGGSTCWAQVGETRLCAEVSEFEGFVRIDEARAQISDRDGQTAEDTQTYLSAGLAPVVFEDVSDEAGFSGFFNGNSHTGGVAWIDYDDDGFPDLFAVGGADTPNVLYHNEGDGTFVDATPSMMQMTDEAVAGVVFADIDNDGDDDLYVYSDHAVLMVQSQTPMPVPGDPNRLFRNDGGGNWSDVTASSGLDDLNPDGEPFRTISATFGDYDLDGCIDLYTVHWRMGPEVTDPDWDPDRLYRGDCAGGFTDVTGPAGLDDPGRKGFLSLFADIDGDRYPDLYVGNVSSAQDVVGMPGPDWNFGAESSFDRFYRNRGDGTFEEISEDIGVGKDAVAGMGIALADFDGDADFDIFITDIDERVGLGNVFYRNQLSDSGSLGFVNEAFQRGARPMASTFGWGAITTDFNHDAAVDLFFTGTHEPWLLLNDGTGEFVAASSPQPKFPDVDGYVDDSGITPVIGGIGTAAADYDRDGDMDIVMWVQSGRPTLMRNDTDGAFHWIGVRLEGTTANRSAIGAVVVVETPDGRTNRAMVLAGEGQQSQSERVLHFGLGSNDAVERIQVLWPAQGPNDVTEINGPAIDGIVTIQQ